jgi:hypothetical protein
MREDERSLAALENAADLSCLAFAHRDVEEHGALCSEVIGAEELGNLSRKFAASPYSR